MRYVLGFDIGGTKLSVSLGRAADTQMQIVDKIRMETPKAGDYEQSKILMLSASKELLSRHGIHKKDIHSAGISCGGPLNAKKGIILSPPNLPGWDDIHITDDFSERLGVPVYLENDANACALAEWRYGSGRGSQNMIFLTFGTGFGAGLILDGKLYAGANGMAGEIGHCRAPSTDASYYSPVGYGKAGSFESYCSGGGLVELSKLIVMEKLQLGEKVGFCPNPQAIDAITGKLLAEAALAGDETAREIFIISGQKLGAALALLVDLLNPEVIVIGSIYTRCVELLEKHALQVLKRESLSISASVCRILPSEMDADLGDMAALSVAAATP